jgi:hypothetical protein
LPGIFSVAISLASAGDKWETLSSVQIGRLNYPHQQRNQAMSEPTARLKSSPPVVTLREEPSRMGRIIVLLVPSLFGSIVFHVVLFAIFFLVMLPTANADKDAVPKEDAGRLEADESRTDKIPFMSVDEDPAALKSGDDIQNDSSRIEKFTVPGANMPEANIGMVDGPKDKPPVNLPLPFGLGRDNGQGGDLETPFAGNIRAAGKAGGVPHGVPLSGSFYGRGGATREEVLAAGQGTTASEAAVTRGLKWLARQQMPDGRWMLNSPNLPPSERGSEANDIAATALGLLPLLATGNTHKPAKDNLYDKVIDKGLKFLIRNQDQQTGYFGGTMYSHGLATIALCEAYGLSQDPILRRPAQKAINLLINTQHEAGGWRYGPAKSAGDLSITGWQLMAIKSAQMASLDVPPIVTTRGKSFLNACANADEGYGYVAGSPSTPRMTAVGLLCRQYMENWGPSHPRMIKAINAHLKNNPPNRPDVYYYYYATQVMHHFGGDAWREWNEKMREYLIQTQDKNDQSANFGSWSAAGDPWGRHGGRLMMTSLNLLTLEVYYRYLPLYYRDAGYKMDKAVQAAQ